MIRRFIIKIKSEKILIMRGVAIGLILLGLYPLTHLAIDKITEHRAAAAATVVADGISKELLGVEKETRAIVEEGSLDSFIVANDREHLVQLLDAERQQRGLSTLAAANKDGMVLARTPTLGSYGDYIFETQAWGRAVAKGQTATMVGSGRTYSLILVAGVPLVKEGKVAGAIFGAERLDRAYAEKFKKSYLANGAHVVFYSTEDGFLGDSFGDERVTALLGAIVNVGSRWVTNGRTDRYVVLDKRTYFVKNIPFPDPNVPEEALGGILVFFPADPNLKALLPAVALGIIAGVLLFPVTLFRRSSRRHALIISVVTGGIVVGLVFTVTKTLFLEETIRLEDRGFPIYNSTLGLSPDASVVDLLHEQQIDLIIHTGGEAINAVQAVLHYDPKLVRVEDILTTNSICNNGLFLDRSIDDKKGEVHISCVILPPAFSETKGLVATLVTQPLTTGIFTLTFTNDTEVLANDGLGTNVLRETTSGSYQVNALRTLSAATSDAHISVFSSTHPNSERWYSRKYFKAFWPRTEGAHYAYVFDQTPETTPTKDVTADNDVTLPIPTDGIFYFHIATIGKDGIGPVTHYKLKADYTPPEEPIIRVSTSVAKAGEIVRFEFEGKDAGSGLQKNFYVNIDDSILLPTLPKLYIPFTKTGKHTLTVRAYDNAGNWRENTVTIEVVE